MIYLCYGLFAASVVPFGSRTDVSIECDSGFVKFIHGQKKEQEQPLIIQLCITCSDHQFAGCIGNQTYYDEWYYRYNFVRSNRGFGGLLAVVDEWNLLGITLLDTFGYEIHHSVIGQPQKKYQKMTRLVCPGGTKITGFKSLDSATVSSIGIICNDR